MIETFAQLSNAVKNKDLITVILEEQLENLDLSRQELREKIENIAKSMIKTIENGLKSTEFSYSKMSGQNTSILLNAQESQIVSPFCKKVMTYAIATIEENARMGKIAACPTAGSSGIVPGVLIAAYEEFKLPFSTLVNALILSGEIGRIISLKVPLAGAVAGCQAECGAASSMASGALCFILGGNTEQIFNAAALSLKNILGLTCDPVAGLVEVPCVKRNLFLAMHSVNAAYVAYSGMQSVIPLDDVVDAMRETGGLMSPKLKESSEAGLAACPAGVKISSELKKLWQLS